ncbi:SDR family oxidoreductase [Hyphomonas sp. KY3]|uniref:SDR family oxidoreductase n=1 Tax=Hyphomonas sp. KY3 TaxID=2016196 RepID=UPI001A8D5FC5|nr:SDR family oxidoreductase [Hyphomonas sp. KY3]QSR21077.1 short-chain dehydrogenase [Hyphomonas sp. KY3]
MELKDKTIIITGASSGIGAAAAILFAAEGAHVVLGARRGSELDKIADQISHKGGKAVTLAGDVNDEQYSKALVDLAQSEFGALNGAFNNAGILGEMGPIPDMSADSWNTVISTNLTSAFFASKYQIPAMEQNGGGSIVFTSSFVGYSNSGMPGMGAYAASKAGLIGLTLSLAAQHGQQKIRVNALLPGGTKTPATGDDASVHEFFATLHELKRMAEPTEIAQSALFLLSDRASFVTGSAVNADGGASSRLV